MKYSKALLKKWRKEGKTLKEISKLLKPKVSEEYVRQMLLPKRKCQKHNLIITQKVCPYCSIYGNYSRVLKQVYEKNLDKEIIRLFDNNTSKEKEYVIQRSILVKKMRDEMGLSFSKIGQLVNRHHTTIINLYEKKL